MPSRRITFSVAVALLAIHATLGVTFALRAAPTWDEVPTFGQGLYLLRTARWDVPGTINHPPLSWYLQSLPLRFVDLDEGDAWSYPDPPTDPRSRLLWRGSYDPWRGQKLLYSNADRFGEDRLIFLGRMATLAIALGAALVLFLWARRLHGNAGGLLALALFALSPNLIAHGALATTDMVMAAFTLASAYALFLAWENLTAGRAAAAGVLWGLACLSKYTALLLLVPFAALLLVGAWRREGPRREGAAPPDRAAAFARAAVLLAAVAGLGLLTLVAGYRGQLGAFVDGLRFQQLNVADGQAGFLFGRLSRRGWWYYYPAVLALKTPLGELALAGIGAALWWWRERFSMRLLFATVPSLFLLAFFVYEPLPVGMRYVLPVYAALQLAAGAVLAVPSRRSWIVAALLLVWVAGSTLRIHPHELSYFNETIGGSRNGWRYLVDSNVDWGQDLKELREWMRRRGVETINLGYFGTADPAYYGIRYRTLPSFVLRRPSTDRGLWPPPGWMAVSATCYWGLCYSGPPWDGNPYDFLHDREPADRVGYSILIFDLP